MQEHYGGDYPTMALQCSVAVKALLLSFGIQARIFAGAVCYPEVYRDDASMFKWSGFWGGDRHVWTVSEFNEFIDLVITRLNSHPSVVRKDVIPVPAVWWRINEDWPPFLRYLPEGPVRVQLPPAQMEDIDRLHKRVMTLKDRFVEELAVEDILFAPVLTGTGSVKELADKGDMWIGRGLRTSEFGKELPKWILEREIEIEEKARELKGKGVR